MKAIKKFPVDTKQLSPKEKAVLKRLILAAELIVPIYLKQKNDKYPGANFFPFDANREEIEKAAQDNPKILDPYTFVERDKKGKLIAIPFHIKFQKELQKVAKALKEAARLSDDKPFKSYLISRADSLLSGNYEKSEIVWLKTPPSKFNFVIGPVERYLDKLFFKKCAYYAWVGINDEKETEKAEKLKKLILLSRKKITPGSTRVALPRLQISVNKTAIFSGLMADFMFTGVNLPNDINLMKKYGSILTISETSLAEKFKKDHLPVFQAVFAKDFQKNYSKEELYLGSLRCIILHEISHSLIRYEDAEERLKDLFPFFDELYAYILGIKYCGSLLLKNAMTQKELEAILIMNICRNFTWYLDLLKNPGVAHYAMGAAITFNFFLKEGAIKEEKGISWPNFAKLFICLDELCHILEYHLALGNYQDAKKFVDKYGSFELLKKYSLTKLKKFIK